MSGSKAHLGRTVAELRGHESRLHRPGNKYCERCGDRRPEDGVRPKRRLEAELDPEREAKNHCAQYDYHAHRPGVADVGSAKIKTANRAGRP